jgi:hypothetical protein
MVPDPAPNQIIAEMIPIFCITPLPRLLTLIE